jgi:uncharacterized protein YdhG (YjbR/CyaY superfamily)
VPKPTTVDEYISAAPGVAQSKLREMRELVAKVAPGASQSLKWGSPAFSYDRVLVMYAAFKRHISFAPTPSAIRAFAKDLGGLKHSSSTIQFPLDRPLPRALITRITKFRVRELESRDVKWMERPRKTKPNPKPRPKSTPEAKPRP